jgi:hypothetical protein
VAEDGDGAAGGVDVAVYTTFANCWVEVDRVVENRGCRKGVYLGRAVHRAVHRTWVQMLLLDIVKRVPWEVPAYWGRWQSHACLECLK